MLVCPSWTESLSMGRENGHSCLFQYPRCPTPETRTSCRERRRDSSSRSASGSDGMTVCENGKSIGDKVEGASCCYILPRNNVPHVHGTLKYAFSRSAVLRFFLPFQSGRSRKMGSISRSCSISIMHTTQCTDSNWFISSNRFMVDKSWYIEEH